MLVIYGGLTGMQATSVGNLFAGAIIPGLLLSGLYIIYVFIRCMINPALGPTISKEEASRYSLQQKIWLTLKYLVPLVLILLVMGTILFGIATPTEAAGMGAGGAFILALANRTLTWKVMQDVATSTLRTTCMIMFLFLAGKLFAQVFMSMGGGDVVSDVLVGGNLSPQMAIFLMLLVVFLLGMFIDWAAILLITVPIFLPIASQLGYHPLWFALLQCVVLQSSFLTPPFGYALFYFIGVAPQGYTMMHIYRGIIPFVFLQILGVIILAMFPDLILWIPRLAFGT